MLNFKTYKEVEEFHRNNHPVQKREVLVEKYSLIICFRKRQNDLEKIFNIKYPSEQERAELLEKRRSFILSLTGISKFSKHHNNDFVCVTDPYFYKNIVYEDESDFSSIYELF